MNCVQLKLFVLCLIAEHTLDSVYFTWYNHLTRQSDYRRPLGMRKVRASQGRVPANYRSRRLEGKC
ncbi:MAG: hypothetical protein K2L52_05815, partial [Clostridia bacterium]|nr:hypothetical protein [Clostridia bacterium]